MAIPNLKRMLASRKLKLGHSVFEFNSPGLGQIIAAAGIDFIFMDMEHSGFGIGDVKRAITGFRAGNLPVMVRPPLQRLPSYCTGLGCRCGRAGDADGRLRRRGRAYCR